MINLLIEMRYTRTIYYYIIIIYIATIKLKKQLHIFYEDIFGICTGENVKLSTWFRNGVVNKLEA